jgi:NitT/TauT family transport system ATP-binding protein
MTSRPGAIDAVYPVPLKRPRSIDVLADPVFVDLTQKIRQHFSGAKTD